MRSTRAGYSTPARRCLRAASSANRGRSGRCRRQPSQRRDDMSRPVTLFTGQWADLPLAELAAKCGEWGFDGLELACWGDHYDVLQALGVREYGAGVRALLEREGLGCWA